MALGVFFSVSERDSKGNPLVGAQQRLDALKAGLVKPIDITIKHSRADPWDAPDYKSGAEYLVSLDVGAFFSSCYPTMTALSTALTAAGKTRPIVYAGLFNNSAFVTQPYPTGYLAFGNNVTGFVSHEFDVCAGWPRYLRIISQQLNLNQAAVLYESGTGGGKAQFDAITAADSSFVPAASKLHIDLSKIKPSDLDQKIKDLAGKAGLIVTTGALTASIGDLIVQYANQYGVLAIYPNKMYVEIGGLISWGTDLLALYKNAGVYLAQIFEGDPDDPVPPFRVNHSFELAFNLATASSLNVSTTVAENIADWIYDGSAWHRVG